MTTLRCEAGVDRLRCIHGHRAGRPVRRVAAAPA